MGSRLPWSAMTVGVTYVIIIIATIINIALMHRCCIGLNLRVWIYSVYISYTIHITMLLLSEVDIEIKARRKFAILKCVVGKLYYYLQKCKD
jgi:hypothetical protein